MKFLKWCLFLLYTLALVYIVFFARRRKLLVWHDGLVNLVPLVGTIQSFRAPQTGNWNFMSNLFGNILLFVPYSFFMESLFRISNRQLVVLIGLFISISIEYAQYIWHIGVPDIDDVILNVVGVIAGVLIYDAIWLKYYGHGSVHKLL
jgi:glycopeptide antibiotics resistance protein